MVHLFSLLVAASTLVLIFAGGLVTSTGSGLAVPDWPNTYGWFMFSFPLDKMVGGIFYEHGHRLIASTVGFLILVLAFWLWRVEPRRWVRRLGFIAVVEEECTGNGTLHSVRERGVRAPEVVLLEPTDLGLMIGGVGVMWIEVEVAARAGHAFDAASHASAIDIGLALVERLRRWCDELRLAEPEPDLDASVHPYSLNLGKLAAGDWISNVPSSATLGIRIGFPRAWTAEVKASTSKTCRTRRWWPIWGQTAASAIARPSAGT